MTQQATADDAANTETVSTENQSTDQVTTEQSVDQGTQEQGEGQSADQTTNETTDDTSATNADTDGAEERNLTVEEILAEYGDFQTPEGKSKEDIEPLLNEFAPIFDKLALSQEEAQMVLDHTLQAREADSNVQSEAWNTQLEAWVTELKNDPEIGGDRFEQAQGAVSTALDKFGSKEAREILETSGLIKQPEIFKMLLSVGTAMSEDRPGNNLGGQNQGPLDRVDIMYPDNN